MTGLPLIVTIFVCAILFAVAVFVVAQLDLLEGGTPWE
jgi:hypothetical protein